MIKCLSLWQPWATLMAIGAKRIETRSWSTHYRGWLAIHAAKAWSRDLRQLVDHIPSFARALGTIEQRGGSITRQLPGGPLIPLSFGAIVALVHLTDCVESTADNCPPGAEACFGDYTPGRFQWRTDRVIDLGHEAIATAGARGLFTLPFDIERRLARRIEAAR